MTADEILARSVARLSTPSRAEAGRRVTRWAAVRSTLGRALAALRSTSGEEPGSASELVDDSCRSDESGRPVRRRRNWFAGSLAVAVVVIAAVVIVLASTRSGDPIEARASLNVGHVQGQAFLYRNRVVIDVHGLPTAPNGSFYRVWMIPHGSTVARPLRTLTPEDGSASLISKLPAGGPFAAITISLDTADHTTKTPGDTIVGARFS